MIDRNITYFDLFSAADIPTGTTTLFHFLPPSSTIIQQGGPAEPHRTTARGSISRYSYLNKDLIFILLIYLAGSSLNFEGQP